MRVNSLVDEEIIDSLYAASRVGVPIDLVVRGICSLRPGVPGLSDTIRVRSILGRFLEHSRVFRFTNRGEPEIWIGSADLMYRNLDRRVEAVLRIHEPHVRSRISEMLELALSPDVSRWELEEDGNWRRVDTLDGERLQDYQQALTDRSA